MVLDIGIGSRVKRLIKSWLDIQPAPEYSITLIEKTGFMTEVIRSQLWYRGDAYELSQFFKQLGLETNSFWSSVPESKKEKVRKIHSGLPAVIADTLAYIVYSDMDDIEVAGEDAKADFEHISEAIDFVDLTGKAVVTALVDGDGAFKISVDTKLSDTPIVEFVGADKVEYDYARGVLNEVIFHSEHQVGANKFHLEEHYGKGYINSTLYDHSGNEVSLENVPSLSGIPPTAEFDGDYIMAVPLKFFTSKKYPGRGKSIFDGGKSDCFDALDEVISQWLDAVRSGRVKQYIPDCMVPRNPQNGGLGSPNQFGNSYIVTNQALQEGVAPKIEVVQPDINYEAFAASYTNCLLMCLQGLVSPATLGIDVGKMSSADAQREKKDVTGNTRNIITTALEKALPKLVQAVLKTYDNMQSRAPKDYEVTVSFGEYGAPDFDSRVETVGKASTYSIMSVETQVEELWGSSKDDDWKAGEVKRIMNEKGLAEGEPLSVGDQLA